MNMNKFSLILTLLLLPCNLLAQDEENSADEFFLQEEKHPVVLPGEGHICVEDLNKPIDLKMDISRLSLAELRVLRNAFAARQGYAFQSADLRSLFSTTTWYDSLMWKRWGVVEDLHPDPFENLSEDYRENYRLNAMKRAPLRYTPAEAAFVKRLQAREKELLKTNFQAPDGYRVNTAVLSNPWQLETFDPKLKDMLGRNGFAMAHGTGMQLFHVYEQNDYQEFPSFVTTDLYLQLFHFYFDCLLRDIEEERLDSCVRVLCTTMYDRMGSVAQQAGKNKPLLQAAQWGRAYFAIALSLLDGRDPKPVDAAYAGMVADEIRRCSRAENDFSAFLGYKKVMFTYSLFRPRGHYNHSELLQRYFRAMMWLQTAPFGTDDSEKMQQAVLMASVLMGDAALQKTYQGITEPLTFLLGAPDNVTIGQVYAEVQKTGLPVEKLLKDKKAMKLLTLRIEELARRQTRIVPKFVVSSRYKVNLMPQRYMPDAEVLQEMVDNDSPVSLRKSPKALDVMAAMRVSAAERILLTELNEGKRWPAFAPTLERMKLRMDSTDWQQTVATRWMESLREMNTFATHAQGQHLPYFMLTPQWEKKNLNAALASYAELKHDAILYAKQPMGAECGGAGPPSPVLKGYVEPNVAFWQKAVELNKAYAAVLARFGLTTEKTVTAGEGITELAEFLLRISEKELAGRRLSNEEYDQIQIVGSTVEYITLDLARGKDMYLQSWDDIHGTDRRVACVADVYTANSDNVPSEQRCVLYEAVGPVYEMYVVVEIEGMLYLTRGAVFSYREFEQPIDLPRLTDEEWQKKVEQSPQYGIPSWMEEIIVPLDVKPKPNEEIFYSSGC